MSINLFVRVSVVRDDEKMLKVIKELSPVWGAFVFEKSKKNKDHYHMYLNSEVKLVREALKVHFGVKGNKDYSITTYFKDPENAVNGPDDCARLMSYMSKYNKLVSYGISEEMLEEGMKMNEEVAASESGRSHILKLNDLVEEKKEELKKQAVGGEYGSNINVDDIWDIVYGYFKSYKGKSGAGMVEQYVDTLAIQNVEGFEELLKRRYFENRMIISQKKNNNLICCYNK